MLVIFLTNHAQPTKLSVINNEANRVATPNDRLPKTQLATTNIRATTNWVMTNENLAVAGSLMVFIFNDFY